MPDDVETVLAKAFGDDPTDVEASIFWEREARVTKLAIGFGRPRSEIKQQLAVADDPREELRKLERQHVKLSVGVRKRAERRELDELAETARAKHDRVLESTGAELRGRRQRMSLGARVDGALAAAALLTSVPASRPGGGSRLKPDSRVLAGTSMANGLLEAPTSMGLGELTVADRYRMVLGQIVERLEAEVDTAGRRPLTGSAESETREARDARLAKWEGVPSHVVSTLDPSLGSPRTVENDRFRLGRRRSDGSKMEGKS